MTGMDGRTEEAAYVEQVRAYRQRFKYTMVYDRRDLRAKRNYVSLGGAQRKSTASRADAGGGAALVVDPCRREETAALAIRNPAAA